MMFIFQTLLPSAKQDNTKVKKKAIDSNADLSKIIPVLVKPDSSETKNHGEQTKVPKNIQQMANDGKPVFVLGGQEPDSLDVPGGNAPSGAAQKAFVLGYIRTNKGGSKSGVRYQVYDGGELKNYSTTGAYMGSEKPRLRKGVTDLEAAERIDSLSMARSTFELDPKSTYEAYRDIYSHLFADPESPYYQYFWKNRDGLIGLRVIPHTGKVYISQHDENGKQIGTFVFAVVPHEVSGKISGFQISQMRPDAAMRKQLDSVQPVLFNYSKLK